jgi:hypothetical protein
MASNLSTGAAYSTSVATIIAGLTLSDWGIVAGIIGVIGTLVMNYYFKRKERLDSLRFRERDDARLEAFNKAAIAEKEAQAKLHEAELAGIQLRKKPRGSGS